MGEAVRHGKVKRPEFFFCFLEPRVTSQIPRCELFDILLFRKLFIEEAMFLFSQVHTAEAVGKPRTVEEERRVEAVFGKIRESRLVETVAVEGFIDAVGIINGIRVEGVF